MGAITAAYPVLAPFCILVFFVAAFGRILLTVRKKLGLYLAGKAELFEKVMIRKPCKPGSAGGA